MLCAWTFKYAPRNVCCVFIWKAQSEVKPRPLYQWAADTSAHSVLTEFMIRKKKNVCVPPRLLSTVATLFTTDAYASPAQLNR